MRAWLGASLAALAFAGNASALPLLGHHGRWLTDPQGRVVILHGVQVDRFKPGTVLNYVDLSSANVAFIAAAGFNLARVSMGYAGVEPTPGRFDDTYVNTYLALDRQLAAVGVWDLLDLQQGQYAASLAGNGFPDWMVQTGGLPNLGEPFPLGYFSNPAEIRAWDNFWADAPAPDGTGLQAHYAAGLTHLAGRFASAPGLAALEILNEPWPGTAWPTCANPVGCPPGGFDATLTGFYRRMGAALRAGDQRHLIAYEPNVLFNAGAATGVGPLGEANLLFAFHNYCLGNEPGLPALDPFGDCRLEEGIVLANAEAQAQRSGDALLMDEWGNNPDPTLIDRTTAEADRAMVGWAAWAYEDCCGSAAAIVADGTRPPDAPGNLRAAVLAALVRPYPQLIAGTPSSWSYDIGADAFTLDYSTRPVGGGSFPAGADTRVELPALRYPTGYTATVTGGHVVSAPDADPLLVANDPGAGSVAIAVRPANHHPVATAVDCPAEHARVLAIHVHGRGGRIVAVSLYVDGRRITVLRGHNVRRIGIPAGLSNGAVVRISATTAHGAIVTTIRRVVGCQLSAPTTSVHRGH